MGKTIKGIGNALGMGSSATPRLQTPNQALWDVSAENKLAQEQYAPLLQTSQANQAAVAPLQTQALTDLGMAATGQGPSLAEAQLKTAQDRTLAQQLALIQASRGGGQAANQRAILNAMTQSGRGLAQDAATARLAERSEFLNQANIAGQNLRADVAGAYDLAKDPKQMQQQFEMQRVGIANEQAKIKAEQAAKMRGAVFGGIASMATGGLSNLATGGAGGFLGGIALPKKAHGGKVKGKEVVKGDSKKNDIHPHLLSAGEIVVPKTVVKKGPDAIAKFAKTLLEREKMKAKKGK